MTKKAPSIVFAGGGTAGHINPMLAIARAVRDLEPNAKILMLGLSLIHIYLANIARPDHGAILKVGTAHAGEFGGVDNIERTKGELAEGCLLYTSRCV